MGGLSAGIELFLPEQKVSTENEKINAQKSQCLMIPEGLGTNSSSALGEEGRSEPLP